MKYNHREKKIILTALVTVLITILIIIFSEETFQAALGGLQVWWEVVFPSLLPFFIIAEVMMGLGIVHFLGALLEPLMRPVFKVPGVGAFAMAMGLASGYPIGAKITANLRRSQLCTKTEAERLISFTNTADPLFMVGAVAVGMFHRPELGLIIAGSHYISCLIIGFLMRFYSGDEKKQNNQKSSSPDEKETETGNIFNKAINELIAARKSDGRGLGKLIGDAVRESINTLLMIGGFIILFSVITNLFSVTGIIEVLKNVITFLLQPFGLSGAMVLPLISGIFEISNGTNLASQAAAPLSEQVIVCSMIIAWSGLSVHGQVATMINGTDIDLKPYIIARISQALLAGFITFLFLFPGQNLQQPVFHPFVSFAESGAFFPLSLQRGILVLVISLVFSLFIYLLRKIKIIY